MVYSLCGLPCVCAHASDTPSPCVHMTAAQSPQSPQYLSQRHPPRALDARRLYYRAGACHVKFLIYTHVTASAYIFTSQRHQPTALNAWRCVVAWARAMSNSTYTLPSDKPASPIQSYWREYTRQLASDTNLRRLCCRVSKRQLPATQTSGAFAVVYKRDNCQRQRQLQAIQTSEN